LGFAYGRVLAKKISNEKPQLWSFCGTTFERKAGPKLLVSSNVSLLKKIKKAQTILGLRIIVY